MKKILYCVYGVFFTFIVWHVMFAADGFDGAVKNSYEKGMEYPRLLAKQKQLGIEFVGSPGQVIAGKPADIQLQITEHGKPLTGATVSMEVARPASLQNAGAEATANEEEAGKYMMHVTIPEYGHWAVTAKIILDKEEFSHEFRIYAERANTNET